MAKQFEVDLSVEPTVMIEKVQEMADEGKLDFEGDITNGSFGVRGVKGTYRIEGQKVKIEINKKPWYFPWGKVEGKLKEYFG